MLHAAASLAVTPADERDRRVAHASLEIGNRLARSASRQHERGAVRLLDASADRLVDHEVTTAALDRALERLHRVEQRHQLLVALAAVERDAAPAQPLGDLGRD